MLFGMLVTLSIPMFMFVLAAQAPLLIAALAAFASLYASP